MLLISRPSSIIAVQDLGTNPFTIEQMQGLDIAINGVKRSVIIRNFLHSEMKVIRGLAGIRTLKNLYHLWHQQKKKHTVHIGRTQVAKRTHPEEQIARRLNV